MKKGYEVAMNGDREYYVVEFFLNGESQTVNLYENEEDAEKDIESWSLTRGDTPHPLARGGDCPLSTSGIQVVRPERLPYWHDLSMRRDTLEETIIQWLREEAKNVWSNVIASVTSSSLTDVYEALARAAKARQVIIRETVQTSLGPICLVRLPWVDDKIIWALLDTSDPLWTDEIASATGDPLSEVHAEVEQLRKIDVVEVVEARQADGGPIMRLRLHAAERDRLLNGT